MSNITEQEIIDTVRKYIKDKHPGRAILEVVPQGVRQDREWWYVPVRPNIRPAKTFEYYEALAEVENELQKFEHLTVLLVPTVPETESQPLDNESNMARVSWQEITKRFSHIDARFVRCEIGLPQNDGFFTVALYPWWEHPLYIEARNQNKNWGFKGSADGFREVTVYPKNVVKFQISRQTEVIDWDFTQEHPMLWLYERQGAITCNSPLTIEQWMEISTLAQDKLTGYNREADVAKYAAQQVRKWGHTNSFSLGSFPYTLFTVLCQVLDSQSIGYFVASEPKATKPLVVFLIDSDDYIIAEDFEIDVPEFVHKPEWFQPR